MGSISELFAGGEGEGVPALEPRGEDEAMRAFMQNFATPQTRATGEYGILNPDAGLLPTREDSYRDTSAMIDFKLGDGLAVARAFHKPDSQGGQTADGFHGAPAPTKMFGRDSRSHDLNYNREEMLERARAGLKSMGYKPNEVPRASQYKPWEWNNLDIHGEGGAVGNQYNRNWTVPDADPIARRMYEPAPSRKTKMLSTDVEEAALRPQRTLLHPMKVVTEDRQRMKMQRAPRNSDVKEAVLYERIPPRGMQSAVEAPRVWASATDIRHPIGSNDTGDRSVLGRVHNPHSDVTPNPLEYQSIDDAHTRHLSDFRYVKGHDTDEEIRDAREGQRRLDQQSVPDTFGVRPTIPEEI